MNQSTSFAQVATNQFDYLSNALCANTPPYKKHSSSRKSLTSSISLRLLLVMFLTLTVSASAWGAEELVYTLDGTITGGSNGYATNSELTINELDWVITGNTTISPWRIGGKSLSGIDRAVYSNTAMPYNISKIEITHGTASSITVNSFKLIISDAANDSGTEIPVTFKASATTTIELPAGDYTNKYFKFLYNVTVTGSDNKFLQFTNAKFYAETAPAVTYEVTWKVDGETYTEGSPSTSVQEGSKVTILPTNPTLDCSGRTFVGWSNQEVTDGNKPSVLFTTAANSPAINANTTFYAVFATATGGGSTTDTYDWESTSTGNWTIDSNIARTESQGVSSSYAGKINTANTYVTYTKKVAVTEFSFQFKRTSTNSNYNVYIETSTDNSNWSAAATYAMNSFGNGSYTSKSKTFDGNTELYVRFHCYNTTAVRYVDNVSITYGSSSYSDYTTSCTTETAVTLAQQGGTGGTTEVTATYGQPMPAITIPTRTGYTFNGYFDATSGGTKYYNADGTSAKNWDKTANTTLYAQWTCKTPVFDIKIKDDNPVVFSGEPIELTVVGSNIAADATYQWYKYNSATYDELAGEITNKLTIAEATANDAGNYKCVVTNGTCSGENNYTVKMYHIKGLTDNAWTTPFEFEKSGDKEGTFTIELAANTTYYFKLNDGSVWYWNEGTMTHNNCTDWVIEQEGADTQGKANTGITTTVSGTYTFTLNYEDPSKPKLSVTYPQKKMVYFNPDMWDADGAIEVYTVYSWQEGSNGSFVTMTSVEGCGNTNIYQAEIDASHDKLLFIRWNQAHTAWNNNRWNQSIDLDYQTNGQYKIDDWGNNSDLYWKDGAKKSWASYEKTFTPNHTVSFDANGHGTAPEDQCIIDGDKATNPGNLSTTGYTFGGWYKEEGCTNVWDFANDVVTSDITLYAKWTINTHTVTWKLNGGNIGGDESDIVQTYQYGAAIEAPEKPTFDCYEFVEWTPAYTVGMTMPDENLEFTATWKFIPTLSWTAPSYTAALEADNDYPDLITNPADLTGVIYSSSNLAVATIDANTGVITLVGVGETTITASFAGNGTYAPAADASYTLTVVASNCRWVETPIAEIGSTDEVVVTMTDGTDTWALDHKNSIGDYPKAQTVAIIGDVMLENPADIANLQWNIHKVGTKYTLYPSGESERWLYGVKSYIKVGTGENKAFILYSEGNHECFAYIESSNGYYIGIGTTNSQYAWKNFSSTNHLAKQTLKFYKRECLDASKVWVEGNFTNVTCDKQLPQQLAENGSFELTFTAADGYELPNNVIVTNATKTWNQATGTLTISNPTGNVMVTVEAVELHTITWMVGSNSVLTEEVANATGVTQTPADNPANGEIGECANAFMGWSETPLGSTEGQSAPADLCTAEEMKAKYTSVNSDKIFYAVFATKGSGGIAQGTVLWAENFEHFDDEKPSDAGTGTGTTIYGDASITYSQSSNNTKSYNDNTNAGGTLPELLLYKGGNHTWTIAGIPTGGATKMTLSFLSNRTDFNVTSSTTGITINGSGTAWNIEADNDVTNFTLTIKNTSSEKNARLDNVSVVVAEGGVSYSNYVTNCCALAPATNLTVSGTTSNTATLTWTAPSPIIGITKLQVRNAADDAVVVDDIAVGTTTATITGLTECTKYNYYVASVGDCEVFSNTVTAQPFSNAKTVNYDYNGGSGSPASFTTSCENQVITLPTATRAGYDFNGWYTAATGGTKVGDAGDSYNPTTSSITLYAQWTKKIYIISFEANGGTGTMANQSADENDVVAQLNANQFTRDGYAFVGWNTTAGGTGIAYADQATDITLTGNLTLYAQWAAIVTLNDAGNVTTTHPETAGGSITLEDGANACDPYEFVGWTTVATGDWNEGINEPALVATTYTPNAPTTLYAVYKIQSEGNANAFKLSFEGGNGKTYYVDEYSSSPLRGYSNISKEDAVTFIRTKMYPNDDTRYYLYMEEKGEYLYYNGYFNSTSSTPDENQGWIFHTVGDQIKLQSTYSYDPEYLSFSDRDDDAINMGTNASGSLFNMLPAVTSTYVAAPLCEKEITITFETGNGDFVDNAPATNPLTVTQGETITLPTCEYPGYEFMGWLKDEQQLDPSDILVTYYTEDYTVSGISSSITFYAYYKAVPEEVEFTGTDDAELLMYHYDGTANYYYASSLDGGNGELPSMQNCFNATTWTFTNVGNMQYHIQDETGKYLGAVNDNDNDLSLSNTPKVWNFTLVNGLWKMVCEDSPSRALMYISTGGKFANAAITNEGNGAYSYITLGICPYPTYTTNPVLSQGFSITNTAMVTSASGQKVKATSALTLETHNIELPCTFTISAPNITFYDNTGAEVTQLTSSAASEQFELHFAYKPTAENTMEYPTITITDDELKTYTIKNRIYARSLPATFAIVAKVGNLWYALPSQGLNSTDALVGYPVEVDNQNDPTAVTAVPENADWSLRGVYEASRSDATKDRYVVNGDNLVFVNNASPAMALNASTSGNYLLTDAQYANYYQNTPGLYEWTPTTTDLETYQLTNEQRSRTLSVNTATVFGVHATDKAVEQVRFLPIQNRYIPAALQVVEWKENSVVIMYNGDPAQTASVSVNGAAAQNTTLSAAQRDIAVYELAAPGMAANPTQRLSITIGTEKVILSIPYIISGAQTDLALLPGSTVAARQEVAKVSDLVILKDATLTADGAKGNPYKFRNVTIYGGGKLVIPSEAKGFGVASLTLRAGGITDAGEYDYVYPQFELRGTFTNSAAKINYDYITDYYHWYHLVLPFDGDLGTIKYPTEFYGANVAANNTGSWQIKRYAGEIRATGNYNAWVDIETEGKTSTTAGQGYIFWGAPKKVTVNGETTRQKWGIQRITMSVTAPNVMTAENGDKTIDELSSYKNVANNSGADNDQGWNLIGNPYMVNLTTMSEVGLKAGKLVEEIVDGKWTGKWINNGDNLRYLTIPSEHFETYTAKTVVQSVPLVPGRAFFVQLEGEANGITFATANRASLMPALLAENSDKPVDIETGIVLSNETLQDEVNFWVKDGKTNDYEYNADYPKTPNNNHFNIYGVHTNGDLSWVATGPEYAAESMPIGYQVPAAGTYMLSLSETYYSEDLHALYVTDHAMSPEVTVDLMAAPYEFSVNQAETNNERFTISVKLKSESQGPTTGLENTGVQRDGTIKFIYQDKIFILHHGKIYDATGKQVTTINK